MIISKIILSATVVRAQHPSPALVRLQRINLNPIRLGSQPPFFLLIIT